MENRRPTSTDNAPRPLNRPDNFRREGDNNFRREGSNQFEPRRSQSRDNGFQPRTNNSGDRFQSRDDRPRGGGDNRFQGRNDRDAPRSNGKFQPRDNNKFQPRGRFAPKGRPGFKPWEEEPRPRIVSENASNRRKTSRKISAKCRYGKGAPDGSPHS